MKPAPLRGVTGEVEDTNSRTTLAASRVPAGRREAALDTFALDTGEEDMDCSTMARRDGCRPGKMA
jgi:hypothetical protein